jgi:integral membrane protein (TIGR00529 family)
VFGSLGAILLTQRFGGRLLPALLVGTAVLAAVCGFSPAEAGTIAWQRSSSPANLFLMAIVFQVVWLSEVMARGGALERLLAAVRTRIPPRYALGVLPAVIGLLPMPGGAIFSAPLVGHCDPEERLDPLHKTEINFWFRHVWEYWWPLYPGVLLAVDLTHLGLGRFVLIQLPLSALAILVGYGMLLRTRVQLPPLSSRETDAPPGVLGPLAPIIVVIGSYALLRVPLLRLGPAFGYLPMFVGLTLALLYVQWRTPLGVRTWLEVVFSTHTLGLALVVCVVRIYGAFIEARLPAGLGGGQGGVLLIEAMRSEFLEWGVPLGAMVVLLPFISAVTSGLTVGFVGASFPVIFGMVGSDTAWSVHASTVVLAYVSGYAGMLLSPVHVCLVVTNEHFSTSLPGSLWRLARPACVLWLSGLIYAALIRVLGQFCGN